MSFDLMSYQHVGDKKNSEFFEEYRLKIYQRRASCGLDQMLGKMRGVVIQVETNDALPYMEELYVMSPYRFAAAYRSETHNIYILVSEPQFPRLLVIEPLDAGFEDDVKRLNMIYPLARATQRVFEVWITVAAMYFGLCFVFSWLFARLERRMERQNR